MRVIAFGAAAILAGWAMPAAAQDKQPPLRLFDGACSDDSQIAGTPYGCNALIHARIDPKGSRVSLMFARKGDDSVPLIALGGNLDSKGNLIVDGIQLKPGERTPFTGTCMIERKKDVIKSVRCTATETGGAGRKLVIGYAVTGEVKLGD